MFSYRDGEMSKNSEGYDNFIFLRSRVLTRLDYKQVLGFTDCLWRQEIWCLFGLHLDTVHKIVFRYRPVVYSYFCSLFFTSNNPPPKFWQRSYTYLSTWTFPAHVLVVLKVEGRWFFVKNVFLHWKWMTWSIEVLRG